MIPIEKVNTPDLPGIAGVSEFLHVPPEAMLKCIAFDVDRDLTHRQKSVFGHWTFSKNGQADCARFVSERKIDVDRLFTHRWTLDQADEAYQLLDQQKTGKGVFLPS